MHPKHRVGLTIEKNALGDEGIAQSEVRHTPKCGTPGGGFKSEMRETPGRSRKPRVLSRGEAVSESPGL